MSDENSNLPYIPAWIDEAGLTVHQFRVACHLWRRGETFSNTATIAKVCRMKRNTVFAALAELEKAGFIQRKHRPGQTTVMEPVPFGDTGSNDNPTRLGIQDPTRLGIQDPTRLGIHKGTPTKVIPLRQSKGKPPSEKIDIPFPSEEFAEAWQSWEQHRREKRKPLTPTSTKMQFREFVVMGEQRAIAAIHHSITKGWTGIFEPNGNNGNGNGKPKHKGLQENIPF
jgi:hypothetical protein